MGVDTIDPGSMTEQSQAIQRIVIRSCSSFDELDACVDIQEQVWGYDERDIIPRRLFTVAQRIGGQVFGAFLESSPSTMIGFAMALPGYRDQFAYLHSHMLAVLPLWRNSGVGRRLKLAQREHALTKGFRLMEWTFDPLEVKNAFLNIARLGVIVRSYTPNFYGPSTSDLQGGLQTDRLHAEWWMDSSRVRETLAGNLQAPGPVERTIEIPHQVAQWKKSEHERKLAIDLQTAVRESFLDAFADGLCVIGFSRNDQGDGMYQLGRIADPSSGL